MAKKETLSKRKMASILLMYFGPNGEHWQNYKVEPQANHEKCCLTEAVENELPKEFNGVFLKELKDRLGMTRLSEMQRWNDRNKWPAIKRLLTSIRDGRKFDKAAAEALK